MAHGEGANPAGNACIGLPPCEDGSCQACQDGLARLQHDVVTLPADQQALGLVEAILEQTTLEPHEQDHETWNTDYAALVVRLSIIQGNAERLKVLLEKGTGPAPLDALKVAHFALLNKDKATGNPDERAVWQATAKVAQEHLERAIEAAS